MIIGDAVDDLAWSLLVERYKLTRRDHPDDTDEAQAARRATLERATRTDRRRHGATGATRR